MKQSALYTDEVIRQVLNRLSGADTAFSLNRKPSDHFFIGTLNEQTGAFESRIGKTGSAINSTGIMFQVGYEDAKVGSIKVRLSGAYYYRVFPEYSEVTKCDESMPSDQMTQKRIKLPVKFKKKIFEIEFEIDVKQIEGRSFYERTFDFSDFCQNLANESLNDPQYFVYENSKWYETISIELIKDKKKYDEYTQSLDESNAPKPEWNFSLDIVSSKIEGAYLLRVIFKNTASKPTDKSLDNTIFESKVSITPVKFIPIPFELSSISSEYTKRGERMVQAAGINASVVELNGHYETEHTPKFISDSVQQSLRTKISLTDLIGEGWLDTLDKVLRELGQQNEIFYSTRMTPDLSGDAIERLQIDRKRSENELKRFKSGISLLAGDKLALKAFKLMNLTFFNSRKKIDTWRPFQIIFIVSVIPDLVPITGSHHDNMREYADLLYFPTGGGKTEAFLGLAVFQAFYDRLAGKKSGVSVLIKFPLRMLSAQQLQRVADVFGSAEKIRAKELSMTDQFSVGYYVGDRNTPNKLIDTFAKKNVLKQIIEFPELSKKWQIIQVCPFCGGDSISIRADEERIRLLHFCENKDCVGELPIYISDFEIYRYLPTVVVSTIDKMVTIGIQPNFRTIIGKAKYRCKYHGFSPDNKCIERTCNNLDSLEELNTDYDMSPSLLIQDEIHLLKESFGTLDSHYETALDQLIMASNGGQKNLKVVCSSATVSKNYENEIGQIYQREINKFPINYEIFTKKINGAPQRVIVGMMPHSRTLINSIERVLIELFKGLKDQSQMLSREDHQDDLYKVVLTYHNKKDDANALNRSITNRVSKELEENNYPPLGKRKLTGDETFEKVKNVMQEIEQNTFQGTLIATSLVSHGIDLDQLNTMVFMGMPGNNAEYVQALSRVGRRLDSTGIVFVLFNPWRERDQSYYTNFSKFHDLIELVIEGTPINRWAEDALRLTIPGIFCSYLYNIAASREGMTDIVKPFGFTKHYESGKITKEEITEFIKSAYRVTESPDPDRFASMINRYVEDMVSQIIENRQNGASLLGFVLKPGPLTNFRSISQPVKVFPDMRTESVVQYIDFGRGESE